MTVTPQQTAEAYWLLYQSLPDEAREEIRRRIQYYGDGKNPPIDFSKLATKGWLDAGKTYDRNSLYE